MKYALMLLLGVTPLLAKDSCIDCHSSMEGNLQAPALAFKNSVHFREEFTCAACHGGDPNSDDPQVAMSPAHGFVGKIRRTAIPKLCARCHSDPNFMRKYNPSERVDQYAEYVTSVHGQLLAKGDVKVATCVDCHDVHDIRATRDPISPVYPTRLPKTCAHCHADAGYMAAYKIPTNQYAEYLKSIHWEELSKRGDLSAPNCATCHGNHGAKPPAVSSVAAVCGTCHAIEDQLFEKSPHQAAFSEMPIGGCVVCHSNHAVLKASDKMLAGPNAVCSECHEPDSVGGKTASQIGSAIHNLETRIEAADAIIERAQSSGMEVSDAVVRQRDAQQALIQARVHVHTYALPPVMKQVDAGLAIAAEDYRAGQAALRERNVRRIGLAVSLIAILITMAGLWLVIRSIQRSRS